MIACKRVVNVFRLFIWTLCSCRCLYGLKFLKMEDTHKATNNVAPFTLPGVVIPEEYELTLFTHLEDMFPQFYGHVHITVLCLINTEVIMLNTKKLEVKKEDVKIISLTDESEVIEVEKIEELEKYDRISITLRLDLAGKGKLMKKNRYMLQIKFSSMGHHDEFMDSGYIINPADRVAFTKLNRFDARLVFPCFDLMNLKAEYKIYLGHAPGLKALTNAEWVATHTDKIPDEPEWALEEFRKTVPMSTLSVAIVLVNTRNYSWAEFQNPSLLIRVSVEDNFAWVAEKINDVVLKIFKFFSKLFVLAPYPLRKIDVVAFSDNHVDMESSYGLIILSDIYLTVATHEAESTPKFDTLSGLCILISRQWIGHSVTMSTYDELWLHEGLNLFLQTLCVNEVFSDMEFTYSENKVVESFLSLLKTEENGSGVMVYNISPHIGISSYDYLSKQKIFHIIRMVHLILGRFLFRKFLGVYATRFMSSNTSLDAVWHVFKVILKTNPDILPELVTVDDIIIKWATLKGHPLLTVFRDDDNHIITIEQRPFILYEQDYVKEDPFSKHCWIIPLTYTTNALMKFEDPPVRHWVTCEGPLVIYDFQIERSDWIIFNVNLDVMARVNYDNYNWGLIQSQLLELWAYKKISILTRVRLISDIFALAEAKEILYTFLFNTMKYLWHERSYQPWKVALEEFSIMRKRLVETVIFEPFQAYMKDILDSIYDANSLTEKLKTVGYKSKKLQIAIIEASCLYELKACVNESLKIVKEWNSDSDPNWSSSYSAAISTVIHCQKVKGDNNYWKSLWKQYLGRTKSATVQDNILKALGCSRDTEILKKYLEHSIDMKKVLPKDSLTIFKSLITNENGYDVMIKFFVKKYDRIRSSHQKRGIAPPLDYLKILLDLTRTDDDLKTLIDLAKKKSLDVNDASIKKRIANSRRHIEWFQRHKVALSRVFEVQLPFEKPKPRFKSFFK